MIFSTFETFFVFIFLYDDNMMNIEHDVVEGGLGLGFRVRLGLGLGFRVRLGLYTL